MNIKQVFHYISYLQYPFLILTIYHTTVPYLNGLDHLADNIPLIFKSINKVLLFMGLAISFSTLQDASKTSVEIEKKIWKSSKKRIVGLYGYFISENENVKEIALGTTVLGIGLISFVKTSIEVYENHKHLRVTE